VNRKNVNKSLQNSEKSGNSNPKTPKNNKYNKKTIKLKLFLQTFF